MAKGMPKTLAATHQSKMKNNIEKLLAIEMTVMIILANSHEKNDCYYVNINKISFLSFWRFRACMFH